VEYSGKSLQDLTLFPRESQKGGLQGVPTWICPDVPVDFPESMESSQRIPEDPRVSEVFPGVSQRIGEKSRGGSPWNFQEIPRDSKRFQEIPR
jgi:hypothetical protein